MRSIIICSFALWIGTSNAGGGHAHGPSSHGNDTHEPENLWRLTHVSDVAEAYVHFQPFQASKSEQASVYITKLSDFQPLKSGVLNLYLKQDGATKARFRVKSSVEPGKFLLNIKPRKAGLYDMSITVESENFSSQHDFGQVRVFSIDDQKRTKPNNVDADIRYSKQQQWDNEFALTAAQHRALRPSISGFATVQAPPQSSAIIRAPSDGFYSSNTIQRAGNPISANDLLGYLIPRFGDGADYGDLIIAQERARAEFQLAKTDEKRLRDLYQQGAIPKQRYEEAQQAFEVAKIELSTAQSRIKQRTHFNGETGISLRAPIQGTIVKSHVRPGTFVEEGDVLFSISRDSLRWLNIAVPEKFASHIKQVKGAWINHNDQPIVLDEANGAQVAEVAQQLDPVSRTLSIAIEYPSAKGPSLIGQRLPARVYVDESQSRLSIPFSAVIDDAGRPVVYVQTSGETFTRRNIKLGMQDGAWVEIINGIQAGERVVSQGAYFVKLASTGSDSIGHGHAH